jgi:hypothetical protein
MPLTLVYDGGCLFCRSFALRSELLCGLPDLKILDGRADDALRRTLEARGMRLADGAVLMSRRMQPSDPLMMVLRDLFRDRSRAEALYPGLLLARRLALGLRGLPVDPDQQPHG